MSNVENTKVITNIQKSREEKEREIGYFFRPECGNENRYGKLYGPYKDFLQLTYHDLRSGPDGQIVAQLHEDGFWYVLIEETNNSDGPRWSDLVISAELIREDGCPERIAEVLEATGWTCSGEEWFNPNFFTKGTSITWRGAAAWAKLVLA